MTENKRFTYSNTYGWNGSAFRKVMNGLDEKNKELKERIKQQEELISEQAIQLDYLKSENHHMKQVLDENNELKRERDYFERKKEEYLSKWSIAHSENIQLRQENEWLKQSNKNLEKIAYPTQRYFNGDVE